MFVICGVSALFLNIPAVYFNAKPLYGVAGFATSLVYAAIPPLVVLGWRRYFKK